MGTFDSVLVLDRLFLLHQVANIKSKSHLPPSKAYNEYRLIGYELSIIQQGMFRSMK